MIPKDIDKLGKLRYRNEAAARHLCYFIHRAKNTEEFYRPFLSRFAFLNRFLGRVSREKRLNDTICALNKIIESAPQEKTEVETLKKVQTLEAVEHFKNISPKK